MGIIIKSEKRNKKLNSQGPPYQLSSNVRDLLIIIKMCKSSKMSQKIEGPPILVIISEVSNIPQPYPLRLIMRLPLSLDYDITPSG